MRKLVLSLALIAGPASALTRPVSYTLPSGCAATKVTPVLVGFDVNDNIQGTINVTGTCIGHLAHGGTYRYAFSQSSPVTWDWNGGYANFYNASLATFAANSYAAVDPFGNTANVVGSQVSLTVVSPPSPIVPVAAIVPNVIGDTLAQADAALSAWSLLPSVTVNYNVAYPVGQVFNQLPAAGTVVPFGTYVYVWERGQFFN